MFTARTLFAALAFTSTTVFAQTTVTDAWVRGTVAQQKATGAFMQIQSKSGGKLVSVSSPAAGVVQIHEMKMDGNTMQMRAITALDLPAGQPVDLKPGGYHVMLLDLKQALKAGDSVPVTLVVEAADKKRETINIKAQVRASAAAAPAHEHKH